MNIIDLVLDAGGISAPSHVCDAGTTPDAGQVFTITEHAWTEGSQTHARSGLDLYYRTYSFTA